MEFIDEYWLIEILDLIKEHIQVNSNIDMMINVLK